MRSSRNWRKSSALTPPASLNSRQVLANPDEILDVALQHLGGRAQRLLVLFNAAEQAQHVITLDPVSIVEIVLVIRHAGLAGLYAPVIVTFLDARNAVTPGRIRRFLLLLLLQSAAAGNFGAGVSFDLCAVQSSFLDARDCLFLVRFFHLNISLRFDLHNVQNRRLFKVCKQPSQPS